ncbi:hypothetical protein TNCV_213571 [Trichonephila clavipes]|nr:hypothetical protein TNCV_213571 [Trichonephila clavipes]
MLGSGPYVFSLRKPDEDVDKTPLFSHSVARGRPLAESTPGGCLDSALYRMLMWKFTTYIYIESFILIV